MKDRMGQCEGHGRHHGMHGGLGCGTGCEGGFHRRFWTKAERLAMLEDYQKAIQAELEALEEKIAALKKAE